MVKHIGEAGSCCKMQTAVMECAQKPVMRCVNGMLKKFFCGCNRPLKATWIKTKTAAMVLSKKHEHAGCRLPDEARLGESNSRVKPKPSSWEPARRSQCPIA